MKKKHIYRKAILFIVILSAAIMPLSAEFEAWMGTGLTSHTAILDSSEKKHFGTVAEDTNAIDKMIFIGLPLDVSIFPDYKIPVGFRLASEMLFPIGFNEGGYFRSFHGDIKNRNLLGLCYAQTYGKNWGLFAELGYEFDIYRIAQTNAPNYRPRPDYAVFNNHSLYGAFGILTTIEKGYFKLGINYSHSLINNAAGFDLLLSGGYRFK